MLHLPSLYFYRLISGYRLLLVLKMFTRAARLLMWLLRNWEGRSLASPDQFLESTPRLSRSSILMAGKLWVSFIQCVFCRGHFYLPLADCLHRNLHDTVQLMQWGRRIDCLHQTVVDNPPAHITLYCKFSILNKLSEANIGVAHSPDWFFFIRFWWITLTFSRSWNHSKSEKCRSKKVVCISPKLLHIPLCIVDISVF